MAKDPAFLFYYQDFLVGTEFMTNEEIGIYIKILCHQADKGRLSQKHMLSICKAYGFSDSLQSKFMIDENGFYYNERLEQEVQKRRKYTESRRNNAKSEKAYAKHMENENENKDVDYNKSLLEEICNYGQAKEISKEVCESYFHHYEKQGWISGNGMRITNWKSGLINWAKDKKSEKPQEVVKTPPAESPNIIKLRNRLNEASNG